MNEAHTILIVIGDHGLKTYLIPNSEITDDIRKYMVFLHKETDSAWSEGRFWFKYALHGNEEFVKEKFKPYKIGLKSLK